MSASALLTTASTRTSRVQFRGECQPELHVRAGAPLGAEAPETDRAPGFSGEIKSVDENMLDQAVYYVSMDMVRVFFPATITEAGVAAPGPLWFYATPPVGYAILGFPHVAYFVAVEWVGKLLVSPVSQPFFVGSEEHAEAARALFQPAYAPPTFLREMEWFTWKGDAPIAVEPGVPAVVLWATAGGRFYKLVRCDARTGAGFASMYAVYQVLAALPHDGAYPPAASAAVGAHMLYGAHEVVEIMSAVVGGAPCTCDRVRTAGPVLDEAAAAIAWLASRRVVCTDLRGPNVMLLPGAPGDSEVGRVRLVDFDDAAVTRAPITTFDGYMAVLAAADAAQAAAHPLAAADTFAASMTRGAEELRDVVAALRRAFDALQAAARVGSDLVALRQPLATVPTCALSPRRGGVAANEIQL